MSWSDIVNRIKLLDANIQAQVGTALVDMGMLAILEGIMSKGAVFTAHSAIIATATSVAIDCRGFNMISVECAVSAITSGNWLIEILGCAISDGTFGECYKIRDDGLELQLKTPAINANSNKVYYFPAIANYIKIKATRTTDGTLTCKVTPFNA